MKFLEKEYAQEGLATTTTCRHEVQGRELAEDRHVGFSVHQIGFTSEIRSADEEAGGFGLGTMA
jgi:hypothetical protein